MNLAGFNSLRAGLLRQSKKVSMFDNKIDWVTHLKIRFARREAHKSVQVFKGVYIQGRAQAIELVKVTNSGKCS
jgi:hypothetical protein